VVVITGVFHAQRIKNLFLEGLFIGAARHFFYDGSEQEITRVVVSEFAAGLKFQIVARVLLNESRNGVKGLDSLR
jgi:hypothetical protein